MVESTRTNENRGDDVTPASPLKSEGTMIGVIPGTKLKERLGVVEMVETVFLALLSVCKPATLCRGSLVASLATSFLSCMARSSDGFDELGLYTFSFEALFQRRCICIDHTADRHKHVLSSHGLTMQRRIWVLARSL